MDWTLCTDYQVCQNDPKHMFKNKLVPDHVYKYDNLTMEANTHYQPYLHSEQLWIGERWASCSQLLPPPAPCSHPFGELISLSLLSADREIALSIFSSVAGSVTCLPRLCDDALSHKLGQLSASVSLSVLHPKALGTFGWGLTRAMGDWTAADTRAAPL